MKLIITYYIIGVLVSIYFIYYYRLSNNTKTEPSKNDAILAIIAPWVFPLQIIKHLSSDFRWKKLFIITYWIREDNFNIFTFFIDVLILIILFIFSMFF